MSDVLMPPVSPDQPPLSRLASLVPPEPAHDGRTEPRSGTGQPGPVALLTDADAQALAAISEALQCEGFAVERLTDGKTARERATQRHYDLVIVDIAVPGLRGIEGCRDIRAASDVPIIIVSARHTPADRVLGLEAGADDYMGKPFELAELLSRVHAIIRRRRLDRQAGALIHRVGDIQIDPVRHRVLAAGRPVSLTPSEFRVLVILADATERPVAPSELMQRLWESDALGRNASCRTHISNIRRKLAAAAPGPERILTVPGVGYLLRGGCPGTWTAR